MVDWSQKIKKIGKNREIWLKRTTTWRKLENTKKNPLLKSVKPKSKITILIGPEGDFTESEVEEALKAGFKPVSLGNSRFRAETAAIIASHTVSIANM